jgi:di-heme oxidoreductase (putative peroxidase)
MYTEPSPYNPPGNLRSGDAPTLMMDLTDRFLPHPRLTPIKGLVNVPAYTDFKLHDICTGPNDPNAETINQNQPAGSPSFFAGNRYFLTKRLWNVGSSPNHFHHGKFTTIRESIMAHAGEAQASQMNFVNMNPYDQKSIIEFLKTLKVLPAGTRSLIVDEHNRPIEWPPNGVN